MEKRIRNLFMAGMFLIACTGWPVWDHETVNTVMAQNEPRKGTKDAISVVTIPSRVMNFEKRIETYGNVETRNFSLVSARIPGVIDEIFVEEGNYVIKDQTRLFQIDKIKVDRACEIARQSVSVAEYTYKARNATIARIEADFEKAVIDYERFRRLYEEDKAVTKNAFESQESRYRQLKAALEEAKAGADLALRQVEQAKGQLAIAQKDLEDSLVRAPITGHVSERFHEPGEMAGAGSPVLRIDDLSVLEVSAFLPDQYYSEIQKGETKTHVEVNNINTGDLIVTYKGLTIDSKMRNFEVRTLIKDPPDGIAPGAMAKISVIMEQKVGLGVPRKAILRRTGSQVLFLAEQGKARMVKVETGLELDGWVEILSDGVPEGSSIISMGQDQLEDGSSISVLREDDH